MFAVRVEREAQGFGGFAGDVQRGDGLRFVKVEAALGLEAVVARRRQVDLGLLAAGEKGGGGIGFSVVASGKSGGAD